MKPFQQAVAMILISCLAITGQQGLNSQPGAAEPPVPQATEETPAQLEQLVAPIALYPDSLVAQILSASTYPDEVLNAANWMDQQHLSGQALADAVDKQLWDPSVKALTQFPSVLANMKQNLAWTSELGDAYLNQRQALSDAIQTMRKRARDAGNLKSTSQEKVNTKGKTIVIEPVASDIVYVPEYDPWIVYGGPMPVFPGWYPYPGLFLSGPGVEFGLGFSIGFFAGFGWGWHNWAFDWHHGGRVFFNRGVWASHSRTIVDRQQLARGDSFRSHSFGERSFARPAPAAHLGAFSGFRQGGFARADAFRGTRSMGGFHGGGSRR